MAKLIIQTLAKAEIDQILALDLICFGGLWNSEGYLREIDSPNSNLLILKKIEDHTKQSLIIGVGCLWSILDEAHITLLGINPEYRRQGLGQLLLLKLLQDAIFRKLTWATLEVNVNNQAALNLYYKYGFKIAGTRKGYYQTTGEDAHILWLKDIQSPEFRLKLNHWQEELQLRIPNYN